MRASTLILGTVLATISIAKGSAFQNLFFESPHLPLIPDPTDLYLRVPLSDALPGWAGYVGNHVEPLAGFNSAFLSSAGLSLAGPGSWPPFLRFDKNIIAGSYTAFLQSGTDLVFNQGLTSVSLAQMGLVPENALSLRLSIDAVGPFSVSLGGQTLDLVPLQVADNYIRYTADISAFRGQTAELRITADDPLNPTGRSYLWLDSIVFSPTAVPEPSSLALGLTALAALGITCHFRRRR